MKIKFLRKYLLLFLLFFLPVSQLFGYSAEVKDISGPEYYPAVKKVIDNAQESIHLSMYVVSLRPDDKDSIVYDLCKSLVEAKDRWVQVKVILDQNINYFDEHYRSKVEGKNSDAYKFLKNNGIEVYLDDRYTYTHSKALVVDNEIVVIGSTNWSQFALTRNNEHSVLIRSPQLAESIVESFSEIELAKPGLKRPIDEEKALAIREDFFVNEDLAGRMITKHDERALDLYLLLLYDAEKENTINFNFAKYAKDLGIYERMTSEDYRRQIIKSLRKLKNRYGLIEVEFYHGKNADVELLDINDKKEDYSYPEENYFLLPAEYFEFGWNRKLSFAEKFNYLVNRYMVRESNSEYWSMTVDKLGEKFHFKPNTITKGMQGLSKLIL